MNYTIAEDFELPSHGKVYGNDISGHVKLRSMTTSEEMKRLSPSEYMYENICQMIDDCTVEGPGISSYDMCIGDYQYLLHKLRVVTYGSDYTITTQCPYCGIESQETINLDDLNLIEYDESLENYYEFDLPKSGKHIRIRMQTPRMVDEIQEKIKDFKKRTQNKQPDPTLVYTIMSLIDTIDGRTPNQLKLEDWVRDLPMADTNAIIAHADKLNSMIGVDTKLFNTCDTCGLSYNSTFKMNSEFFRPALDL